MSEVPPAAIDPATGEGAARGGASVSRRSFIASAALAAGAAAAAGPSLARAASPRKTRIPRTLSKAVPAALPREIGEYPGGDLTNYEVIELASLLQSGAISSVELTTAYYNRINLYNGSFETYADNGLYNAFVRINETGGLASAAAADARLTAARAGGTPAPYLCGIPMGFKDSVAVQGFSTQDGNAACAGNIALQDATIVAHLRALGVVPLGLTICSSFSGSTSGTFAGNAWNPLYIPGGSSQGSGTATAGRLAAASIGEETGGSIIFPSAIQGCSGIKPSLGTVSIAGLMPLSPSYDVLGPIARSGRDAALILNGMIGIDPVNDPQTLSAPIPFPTIPFTPRTGTKPLAGITIGVPQTDYMSGQSSTAQKAMSPQTFYQPQHMAAFQQLIYDLQGLGANVITFPGLDMSITTGTAGVPPGGVAPANPYYSSPTVLAVVDGSNVSPSAAIVDSNQWDFSYASGPAAFCESGIPTPASIATLTSNYGRKGLGDIATTFAGAERIQGGIPTMARLQGVRARNQLVANYTLALEAYDVDFMLIMQVAGVVGLRASGGGFGVSRTYYQVNNVLGWPTVSFPIGFTSAPNPVLPISAQFWGMRFSEPMITQAMVDYQAAYPTAHTAIPPNPTPVPADQRVPASVAARSEQEAPSNDILVQEARILAANS